MSLNRVALPGNKRHSVDSKKKSKILKAKKVNITQVDDHSKLLLSKVEKFPSLPKSTQQGIVQTILRKYFFKPEDHTSKLTSLINDELQHKFSKTRFYRFIRQYRLSHQSGMESFFTNSQNKETFLFLQPIAKQIISNATTFTHPMFTPQHVSEIIISLVRKQFNFQLLNGDKIMAYINSLYSNNDVVNSFAKKLRENKYYKKFSEMQEKLDHRIAQLVASVKRGEKRSLTHLIAILANSHLNEYLEKIKTRNGHRLVKALMDGIRHLSVPGEYSHFLTNFFRGVDKQNPELVDELKDQFVRSKIRTTRGRGRKISFPRLPTSRQKSSSVDYKVGSTLGQRRNACLLRLFGLKTESDITMWCGYLVLNCFTEINTSYVVGKIAKDKPISISKFMSLSALSTHCLIVKGPHGITVFGQGQIPVYGLINPTGDHIYPSEPFNLQGDLITRDYQVGSSYKHCHPLNPSGGGNIAAQRVNQATKKKKGDAKMKWVFCSVCPDLVPAKKCCQHVCDKQKKANVSLEEEIQDDVELGVTLGEVTPKLNKLVKHINKKPASNKEVKRRPLLTKEQLVERMDNITNRIRISGGSIDPRNKCLINSIRDVHPYWADIDLEHFPYQEFREVDRFAFLRGELLSTDILDLPSIYRGRSFLVINLDSNLRLYFGDGDLCPPIFFQNNHFFTKPPLPPEKQSSSSPTNLSISQDDFTSLKEDAQGSIISCSISEDSLSTTDNEGNSDDENFVTSRKTSDLVRYIPTGSYFSFEGLINTMLLRDVGYVTLNWKGEPVFGTTLSYDEELKIRKGIAITKPGPILHSRCASSCLSNNIHEAQKVTGATLIMQNDSHLNSRVNYSFNSKSLRPPDFWKPSPVTWILLALGFIAFPTQSAQCLRSVISISKNFLFYVGKSITTAVPIVFNFPLKRLSRMVTTVLGVSDFVTQVQSTATTLSHSLWLLLDNLALENHLSQGSTQNSTLIRDVISKIGLSSSELVIKLTSQMKLLLPTLMRHIQNEDFVSQLTTTPKSLEDGWGILSQLDSSSSMNLLNQAKSVASMSTWASVVHSLLDSSWTSLKNNSQFRTSMSSIVQVLDPRILLKCSSLALPVPGLSTATTQMTAWLLSTAWMDYSGLMSTSVLAMDLIQKLSLNALSQLPQSLDASHLLTPSLLRGLNLSQSIQLMVKYSCPQNLSSQFCTLVSLLPQSSITLPTIAWGQGCHPSSILESLKQNAKH